MAIYLAYDYFSFRGEYAVASGWNQRAHRLLEGLEPTPEQGLLAVYEGYMELMRHNDTAMARSLGSQAAELGRTLGMIDLEMLALALEGLARVSEGDITGGLPEAGRRDPTAPGDVGRARHFCTRRCRRAAQATDGCRLSADGERSFCFTLFLTL
jgi:hypothetical protein